MHIMEIKLKNRHRLKSKEIKKISNNFENMFGKFFFNDKNSVETADYE